MTTLRTTCWRADVGERNTIRFNRNFHHPLFQCLQPLNHVQIRRDFLLLLLHFDLTAEHPPRTINRESFPSNKFLDLGDELDVLPGIKALATCIGPRIQLPKLLLPIPQYAGIQAQLLCYLGDGIEALLYGFVQRRHALTDAESALKIQDSKGTSEFNRSFGSPARTASRAPRIVPASGR